MITCRTLGPVAVTVDDAAPRPELLWRKHLAALVYLARSPHRTRTRDHLVGLLWGDRPEPAARHSLREAIHVLRRAAGEAGVDATNEYVRLTEDAVVLDVDQLEAHVAAGRWAEAAPLVAGEFLEGFAIADAAAFEDWLGAERLHWRSRSLEVLTHCSADAARQGRLDEAVELGRRALRLDANSDVAARATMTALALAGDRGAALEAFDALATRLSAELGTTPDAETQALAERIRSGREWRVPAAEAAPRRGAESRRAPLAGREHELAQLLDAWGRCRSERRAAVGLVEGDSGVGKTRLAEEVVERARLDGAAVSAVRAVPGDAAETLAGIVGLARGGLALARGIAGATPEALATFVARAPEWAERFPGARGAAPLAPVAALAETLRTAADEQPLLLFLDDAHWLDAASQQALAVLLRDLARAPVFFLVTCSSGSPGEDLDALRVRIGRDVPGVAVRLGALSAFALQALARWAFPAYGDIEVDRIARRVATDSAGLPLLAVELLHAVALGLDLHKTAGAWPAEHHTLDQSLPGDLPDAVVAAIRIGFRRLSKDAQAVLAAAAVLKEKEGAATLCRATGLSGERLTGALDEAEWQRWLTADGRGYSFVARIVRDVVARDMLTAGQRQRILEAAGARQT
jgi:DNA-binding SARP family transcriptional activator